MTQFSWNFACVPAAGDAGPLTAENLAAARLFMGNVDPQGAGVVYWADDTPANVLFPGTPPGLGSGALDGMLVPSAPGGGLVRIASGIGLVMGYLFVNDDDVDFDIDSTPGEADATDLIVLRRDNLATTPRVVLARKQATSPSTTAVLQQDATIWEVALAEVLLDGAGELDSVTDVRQLVVSPLSGMVPLRRFVGDGATADCTFQAIQNGFSGLLLMGLIRSTGGGSGDNLNLAINNDAGGANYNQVKIVGTGASVSPGSSLGAASFFLGTVTASTGATDQADLLRVQIPAYGQTTFFKTIESYLASARVGDDSASGMQIDQTAGWWLDTDAINRLDVSIIGGGFFVTGSEIVLYGLK